MAKTNIFLCTEWKAKTKRQLCNDQKGQLLTSQVLTSFSSLPVFQHAGVPASRRVPRDNTRFGAKFDKCFHLPPLTLVSVWVTSPCCQGKRRDGVRMIESELTFSTRLRRDFRSLSFLWCNFLENENWIEVEKIERCQCQVSFFYLYRKVILGAGKVEGGWGGS